MGLIDDVIDVGGRDIDCDKAGTSLEDRLACFRKDAVIKGLVARREAPIDDGDGTLSADARGIDAIREQASSKTESRRDRWANQRIVGSFRVSD